VKRNRDRREAGRDDQQIADEPRAEDRTERVEEGRAPGGQGHRDDGAAPDGSEHRHPIRGELTRRVDEAEGGGRGHGPPESREGRDEIVLPISDEEDQPCGGPEGGRREHGRRAREQDHPGGPDDLAQGDPAGEHDRRVAGGREAQDLEQDAEDQDRDAGHGLVREEKSKGRGEERGPEGEAHGGEQESSPGMDAHRLHRLRRGPGRDRHGTPMGPARLKGRPTALPANLNSGPLHADREMPIRIYNTLTRAKEEFQPLRGRRVSMFVCGITPQDSAHLGHAKTYVAFDVVARFLRHKGYDVFYLQNVTDIEDRVIEKMKKTGRDWKEIVAQYYEEFEEGMAKLNCSSVNVYAWATDYMPEILEQIQGLLDKGYAYVAEDGSVYYDTTKYPGWGKLSGQKVEEHVAGARVAVDERKRNPADFALWKARKPGEPAWDSPWGPGRPGWHIEDTAITIRHFGPQYDIHGGATELMFPHHEAEIAQAEAYTGVTPFVKYWMHGGMLMVKGEEMHKSLGNYWAIKDALAHFEPEVVRFFLLDAHYRSPIDFTLERMEEAKRSYDRLRETILRIDAELRHAREQAKGQADDDLRTATGRVLADFDTKMSDDFNTREALAAMFEYARAVNKAIDAGVARAALDEAAKAFQTFGDILGLFQGRAEDAKLVGQLVELLVAQREDARQRKDFASADRIREALAGLGIALEDTRDGVRWKRK